METETKKNDVYRETFNKVVRNIESYNNKFEILNTVRCIIDNKVCVSVVEYFKNITRQMASEGLLFKGLVDFTEEINEFISSLFSDSFYKVALTFSEIRLDYNSKISLKFLSMLVANSICNNFYKDKYIGELVREFRKLTFKEELKDTKSFLNISSNFEKKKEKINESKKIIHRYSRNIFKSEYGFSYRSDEDIKKMNIQSIEKQEEES